MLKNITITNFRGIKELTIEDFGRVNLLVGGNNSGKTSVLEAVGLVALPIVYFLPFQLNRIRNFRFDATNLFNDQLQKGDWNKVTTLFNDPSSPVVISADNITSPQFPREIQLSLRSRTVGIVGTSELNSLYFELFLGKNKTFSQSNEIKNSYLPETDYKNFHRLEIALDSIAPLRLINPYFPLLLSQPFGEVQNTSANLNQLIAILQKIYAPLKDFRLDADGMILCDLRDSNRLLPLSVMGDGFISVINILLQIRSTKNGIVLIDEIDTGLHYSVMVDMWKAAFYAAKENNVQIFATTHSDECIVALNEAYREVWKDKEEDEIRLYRVSKDDQENWVETYTPKQIAGAVKFGFETR